MLRVLADNINPALSFYDLAFAAYFFDRTSYFHVEVCSVYQVYKVENLSLYGFYSFEFIYNLRMILPFSPSGLISRSTRSPGRTRILWSFILPAMWASTITPESFSLIRNIRLGSASKAIPSFAASMLENERLFVPRFDPCNIIETHKLD